MAARSSEATAHEPAEPEQAPARERFSVAGGRWVRIGAAALVGGLLAAGLRRRSPVAVALAAVAGWLSYRFVGGGGADRTPRPSDAIGRGRRNDEAGAVGGSVARSVTVDRSTEELRELLRDPDSLELIAGRFAEITSVDDERHRWTVSAPLDRELTWETRLSEDRSGDRLTWTSVEDSTVFDRWTVSLEDAAGDRGTKVTLEARFDPPGGSLGRAALERLDVVPGAVVATALDRLKSLAETGEVPTLEANPSARGAGDLA